MSDLSKHITNLSAKELDSLLKQIEQKKGSSMGSIRPQKRDTDTFPLSFAQQRLWFIEQLVPGTPAYHISEGLRLSGSLDLNAMEYALNEIVQRHEILRTVFIAKDGEPFQVIKPHLSLKLKRIDLSQSSTQDKDVQNFIEEETRRPFKLEEGALIRTAAIRLAQDEHIFLLTLHHIISDGWSNHILLRELLALYKAFITHSPVTLPDLPVQYADFSVWQRELLQGERLEAQLNYWKNQLDGELPVLELIPDRPRPSFPSFHGRRSYLVIPPDLVKGVTALGQTTGATLSMVFLAAFQVLLHRYTGQTDLLIGIPIANRNHLDIEALIGFFVNTLVIRTNLSNNPTFRHVLLQVRHVTTSAYSNQDLPFDRLIEVLQPERSPNHNPLFQILFALHEDPFEDFVLPSLTVKYLPIDTGATRRDLSLALRKSSAGLTGHWEYNPDLFDRETIIRLGEHFLCLLESIITDSDQPIASIPLLTTSEQELLLKTWNEAQSPYPKDICIHQWIEAQVERTPDAIAVVFEEHQLTYWELNRRSNQLAHYLKKLGVDLDVQVGVSMERSLELMIVLLGINKAGGAYVFLESTLPDERIALMIHDTQAPIFITQTSLQAGLTDHEASIIFIDNIEIKEALAQESGENPVSGVTPENLVYVIYTSGSTGRPKGVATEHRQLVNYVHVILERMKLTTAHSFAMVSTFAAEIGNTAIFPSLCIGACLHILSQEQAADPASYAEYSVRHQIDYLKLAPSHLRMFMTNERPEDVLPNKWVVIGGEASYWDEMSHIYSLAPNITILNHYSPTETTIGVLTYLVPKEESPYYSSAVPLGRPLPNTQIYILDAHMQPVPIGVAGEIYISGAGMSRGYLNQPGMTAERFIPNPFSSNCGLRLYRSGDLARYWPDGTIEFLNRIDHQVKIRGYRVELKEIESVLGQAPHVRSGVVIAKDDSRFDKRLIAYIVPEKSDNAQQTEQVASEQVQQWQTVFEDKQYDDFAALQDPAFNLAGWVSSYSGEPIAAAAMHEWANYTVSHILSLQPKRVLEIGCGSGMLLSRIAPQCTTYIGTDFSQSALGYVKKHIPLPNVELLLRTANDFSGFELQSFDCVVLNSVVQYFPNTAYLVDVLTQAVRVTATRGSIFIGDVRSLPLLTAFHTAVELSLLSDPILLGELRQRVDRQVSQEVELLIDPTFFLTLKQNLPRITHVEIELKRGVDVNELTQFRYTVILHIDKQLESAVPDKWLNWQMDHLTLSALRHYLLQSTSPIVSVSQIPNARIFVACKAAELLYCDGHHLTTTADLQQAIRPFLETAVSPEDIWQLGESLGYHVDITFSGTGGGGFYDVIFRQETKAQFFPQFPRQQTHFKPYTNYTNNPLQGKMARALVPGIRQFLREKLPAYMIPATYILLEKLPITANGKVDIAALPVPTYTRPELGRDFVPPRTPVEEALVLIWKQTLSLEEVSIHDNFFDLGGHSLLATQIVAQIRNIFGVDLPLRNLFEIPTIAQLSTELQQQSNPEKIKTIARLYLQVENMSEEQAIAVLGRKKERSTDFV